MGAAGLYRQVCDFRRPGAHMNAGHLMPNQATEPKITAWLATQQDAMIALLREMVDTDSGVLLMQSGSISLWLTEITRLMAAIWARG